MFDKEKISNFELYTTALAGNYVNFGVFELYGDRALADALDIGLKISLWIPLDDIMGFRKVSYHHVSNQEVLAFKKIPQQHDLGECFIAIVSSPRTLLYVGNAYFCFFHF